MAQFPISFSFDIQFVLSAFMRSDQGSAEYEKGLIPLRCSGVMEVKLLSLGDMSNRVIDDELSDQIGNHFGSMIDVACRRLNYAVLVDNDDAFFRNLVPSHIWSGFMAMFSNERPLMFTPDVSPPPIRLNMPMLVGHNQTNLMADLRGYLAAEMERQISNVRFDIDGRSMQPNAVVFVHENDWTIAYVTM